MFVIFNGGDPVWKVKQDEKGFTVHNAGHGGAVSLFVAEKAYKSILNTAGIDEKDVKEAYPTHDIFKRTINVRYDNYSMIPTGFTTNKSFGAELVAASITVKKGFRITSVYNDGATVYSREIKPTEYVDFIANLSKQKKDKLSPRITITLVNDTEKRVCTYSVTWNIKRRTISVFVHEMAFSEIPPKGTKGFVNTTDFVARTIANGKEPLPVFFPSSPTQLILCAPGTKDALVQVIKEHDHWRSPDKYTFVEVSETFNELVEKVREGYRAATVGVKNANVNVALIDKACFLFDTVILFTEDTKSVRRLKVHGVMQEVK